MAAILVTFVGINSYTPTRHVDFYYISIKKGSKPSDRDHVG